MKRSYYTETIDRFLKTSPDEVLNKLRAESEFPVEQPQAAAWEYEVLSLRTSLVGVTGKVYLEYVVPRMGHRIDALLLIGPIIVVLEYKVGETSFHSSAVDQVFDYALDLKNFHETSHACHVLPILVATGAPSSRCSTALVLTPRKDDVYFPLKVNADRLREVIVQTQTIVQAKPINVEVWEKGRYQPTPTIIDAALALYGGHSVADISRSDAGATNLTVTTDGISDIIKRSREHSRKSIVFVTGVPGAGKTLVGLNTATLNLDKSSDLYSVFLSGNGPLVKVLREALARDSHRKKKSGTSKTRLGTARHEVKAFIQNVHNFRDECLVDRDRPPIEHVALFDEAQRAWNLEKTSDFMKRKKNVSGFKESESEFLISCLNRHRDWAVVVCLVGGGQEIHTGEGGIVEWVKALKKAFSHWDIFVSPHLTDDEYGAGNVLRELDGREGVTFDKNLHLAVSIRSFRSENVSLLVKQILDLEKDKARKTLLDLKDQYPIMLTRDPTSAKKWLRQQSRGSERYGMVVSSYAERLRPHGIFVKSPMDPVHWFLDGKEDIRSSYFLEDVATEFSIQGLELDWTCVTWDADFRYTSSGWDHNTFVGKKWNRIHKEDRKVFQKNAYRVLLTRARQGMVVVVPEGSSEDATRKKEFYDPTFEYLREIGFPLLTT